MREVYGIVAELLSQEKAWRNLKCVLISEGTKLSTIGQSEKCINCGESKASVAARSWEGRRDADAGQRGPVGQGACGVIMPQWGTHVIIYLSNLQYIQDQE